MRTVIWSEMAKKDYANNIDYLLSNWSEKEAMIFINSVEDVIRGLESGNVDFTPTNIKDVRRCVVCKQVSLFYRVRENRVELLRFWNNYQDRSNLKIY
ncbi:type II toxin-antitoxin system RelE/ParE family toxin [Marinilabiliaceae bacterium JC017]|nr:type II toxin-antitoxin system RelE/ParE family toxin [Marinilabiliaceae bacterium JC017]